MIAKDSIHGALAVGRALQFIVKYPRTLLYCAIPVIISIAVYGLIIVAAGWLFVSLIGGWVDWSNTWYIATLRIGLQIIAAVAVIVVVTMLYSLIANLVAGPFNEQLSQYVERIALGAVQDEPFSWRQFGSDSARSLREESIKLIIFGVPQLLLLLLHLIPTVGSVVYIIVMIPFSGYMLAYEYMDLPLSRHYTSLRDKTSYIYQRAKYTLPFGWTCAGLLAIPVVNLVIMPVCVIAGTLLYCEHVVLKSPAESDRY